MKGLSATLQFTVDQLCASLLLYKVHKLSLNAPFTKKQYWKALPSSIIQDLIVILIFQWATHLIISRLLQDRKHEGYESLPVSRPLDEKVNLQSEDSLESAYSENPHCLQYFPRKSTLKYLLGLALSGILLIIATSINLIVLCTLVAYTARGIVFTWSQILAAASNLVKLFWLLSHTLVPLVLLILASLILGFTFAFLRQIICKHWTNLHLQSTFIIPLSTMSLNILFYSFIILITSLVYISHPLEAVRTDFIIDGLWTLYTFLTTPPLPLPTAAEKAILYGSSNVSQDLLFSLASDKIRNVFIFWLESAPLSAFPFSTKFCEQWNCQDIPKRFNHAQHFTPNFAKLVADEASWLNLDTFIAPVTYTTKSHFEDLCGIKAHMADFTTEHAHPTPLPCMPTLLQLLDETFVTAHFEPVLSFDGNSDLMKSLSYDLVFDKQAMDRSGKEYEEINCYADDAILPDMFSWIDNQTSASQRMLVSYSTIDLHDPYEPVYSFPYNEYTVNETTNHFLNLVRYTDSVIGKIMKQLESRGLLETSLVIFKGDHGPELNPNGNIGPFKPNDLYHRVPFLTNLPTFFTQPMGSREIQGRWTGIDVLPTILDSLGANKSLIAKYKGQSLLRKQALNPSERIIYTAEQPGGQFFSLLQGNYKLVRQSNFDFCSTDLSRDPLEKHLWCNSPQKWFITHDGVTINQDLEETYRLAWNGVSEEDIQTFKDWTRTSAGRLSKFIVDNRYNWNNDVGNVVEYLANVNQIKDLFKENQRFVLI